MSSDLWQQLTDRFAKAIHKSFSPCPLIGPKWLQEFPNGRPADFRFFGIRKLAKAIGRPQQKIVQILLRNLSLDGLDVEMSVRSNGMIDIHRRPQGQGAREAQVETPTFQPGKTKNRRPKPRPKTGPDARDNALLNLRGRA
jgi:hypothetical protein